MLEVRLLIVTSHIKQKFTLLLVNSTHRSARWYSHSSTSRLVQAPTNNVQFICMYNIHNLNLQKSKHWALQSKTSWSQWPRGLRQAFSCLTVEIAGLNPTESMDVFPLCLLCAVYVAASVMSWSLNQRKCSRHVYVVVRVCEPKTSKNEAQLGLLCHRKKLKH